MPTGPGQGDTSIVLISLHIQCYANIALLHFSDGAENCKPAESCYRLFCAAQGVVRIILYHSFHRDEGKMEQSHSLGKGNSCFLKMK